MNLVELHQYFLDNNLPLMRWNELHYPNILSVSSLPKYYLNIAIEQLELSKRFHDKPVQKRFITDMANSLQNIDNNKTNCDELYAWHHDQEQIYWSGTNLKFANLWPEYR
jgi:hypothetical protein